MTPTTAGYLDATASLARGLRELAAMRPAVPVLNLYLNLDPSEFGTQRARESAIRSLLDDAHRRVEEFETDHAGRASLRADLERAEAFLAGLAPKRARGLALFSATVAELFRPYLLPRPTVTRAVVAGAPFITPLTQAADLRDWLIVLVDTRNARFLHGNTDHVEEIEWITDQVEGRHERVGPSDRQRHVERQVDRHLDHAARALDEQLERGRFERVILGGPGEIAPRFWKSHVSRPAQDLLAGEIAIEVPDCAPDAVRRAATPVFDEQERRREEELLDRLATGLARAERAVAGIDAVREMLVERRVETLLYDERHAPPETVLERAVEDALLQSAEVVAVRHDPDALDAPGHIAALLRF